MRLSVLSVGGSIIAPDKVNSEFLSAFICGIRKYLDENPEDKLIFVCGGGAPARVYQQAYREVITDPAQQNASAQDWIGIKATHINAELMKAVLGDLCRDMVVTNPTAEDVDFEEVK